MHGYKSMYDCVVDLEKNNHLLRIDDEIDGYLEAAAVQRLVYAQQGKAILFTNLKNCRYWAVSNLFGTLERSKFIFRHSLDNVQALIEAKINPFELLRNPISIFNAGLGALNAIPVKKFWGSIESDFHTIQISDLPQIVSWEKDGGAFVTLPIVYTENPYSPSVYTSNMGMYRIQLSGNEFVLNKEIGLHYQLHRGIGIHQTIANEMKKPLPVSIFVGGNPAMSVSAVMPLPENLSEAMFAGALGSRNFLYYSYADFKVSADADFVILGYVYPSDNKPEGPFGDHLGYYSLTHDFPVMRVHKVLARRKNPIWSFTVVGRPPQEDTSFGALIHELTGNAIQAEIPGVQAVHAVDWAGVHPLLFALGTERYTPYLSNKKPQEIITQALRILGTGQLSLAKYLFITNHYDNKKLNIHDVDAYLQHVLERIDLRRDLHFITNTTIDTLDYSGDGLNTGSKLILACAGDKIRDLSSEITIDNTIAHVDSIKPIARGILAVQMSKFTTYEQERSKIMQVIESMEQSASISSFPLIVLCDDADFTSRSMANFVWVAFTRSNPSMDVHGLKSTIIHKHFGCESMIIDARIKPHHAPVLEENIEVLQNLKRLASKGKPLYGYDF